MVAGLTQRVSGWLSTREFFALVVPCLLFWSIVVLLLLHRFGSSGAHDRWTTLDPWTQVAVCATVVSTVTVSTVIVSQLLTAVTRLFCGYGWHAWGMRWLAQRARRHQRQQWARINSDHASDVDQDRLYRCFPLSDGELQPTRLGNVLAAAESYVRDDRRYGMDPVFFWPRLYPLLSDVLRSELAASRSAMDAMLVMSLLAGFLGGGVGVAGAAVHLSWPVQLITACAALLVSRLCYLAAVRTALGYAELVRASFDLHRRDLLRAMGVTLPATLKAERALWKALGQQLYRRGADEEYLLRFDDGA
ncbi:hypothetical protein [Streptomyces sp. NPDC058614]|uniref:hypothetical protein n=1 Tax=Streptomyces sp. NPDC058614 TaxID=3346557 RepID=UPI0036583F73